jgi:hypothetical protein
MCTTKKHTFDTQYAFLIPIQFYTLVPWCTTKQASLLTILNKAAAIKKTHTYP